MEVPRLFSCASGIATLEACLDRNKSLGNVFSPGGVL
jgi:hypothetical protein